MNVLSLFDGMACGLVALKRAGVSVDNYFASEIDNYAIQIAKKNHPEIIHLGDINGYESWDLPKIDMIMGGSPCQGFSFIGKRLNFDDERSSLFFKYVDCLKKFDPKYFLLENVRMKKEYQDVISGLLGVEPVLINSALVSAQSRSRLYWCNWYVGQPVDRGILLKDVIEDGVGFLKNRGVWKEKSDKANCVDANYYKGVDNHGQRTMVLQSEAQTIYEDSAFRKLTPLECERLQTLPDDYTDGMSNTARYRMIGNGWTVDVIVHILKSMLAQECHPHTQDLIYPDTGYREQFVQVTF